jgi:small subunit ribosomal protein S7
MNKLMLNGKKSLAERIVYGALESIERTARRSPIDVFDTALRNATPLLEVKPRRVGGATLDASNNTGATIRKRDETHRMAEANKAFSHYRW